MRVCACICVAAGACTGSGGSEVSVAATVSSLFSPSFFRGLKEHEESRFSASYLFAALTSCALVLTTQARNVALCTRQECYYEHAAPLFK